MKPAPASVVSQVTGYAPFAPSECSASCRSQLKPLGDPRRSQWEGFGLGEYLGVPRQSSWNYGTMPDVDKWTNEIAALSPVRPEGRLATVFAADRPGLVADVGTPRRVVDGGQREPPRGERRLVLFPPAA